MLLKLCTQILLISPPPHTHARTHHSNYPPRRFNFFMPRVLQVAGWLAAAGYLLDKRSNPN